MSGKLEKWTKVSWYGCNCMIYHLKKMDLPTYSTYSTNCSQGHRTLKKHETNTWMKVKQRLKPEEYKSDAIVQEQFGSKLTRNHCITIPDRLQSLGPHHIWGQVSLVTSDLCELFNWLFNINILWYFMWVRTICGIIDQLDPSLFRENIPTTCVTLSMPRFYSNRPPGSSISMPTLRNETMEVLLERSDLVPCWKHWNSVSVLWRVVKQKRQQDSC